MGNVSISNYAITYSCIRKTVCEFIELISLNLNMFHSPTLIFRCVDLISPTFSSITEVATTIGFL